MKTTYPKNEDDITNKIKTFCFCYDNAAELWSQSFGIFQTKPMLNAETVSEIVKLGAK